MFLCNKSNKNKIKKKEKRKAGHFRVKKPIFPLPPLVTKLNPPWKAVPRRPMQVFIEIRYNDKTAELLTLISNINLFIVVSDFAFA